MGGTNAHVVLAEAPAMDAPAEEDVPPIERPRVLVLSAKSDEALRQLATRYDAWLGDHPELDWADVCFTTGTGRRHFPFRAALVASSAEQARAKLAALAEGRSAAGLFTGQAKPEPVIGWQFTGQGSQYPGMGAGLYQTERQFRETLDRCAEQLSGLRSQGLLEVVFGEEEILNQTEWTQPALFSLHLALASLVESWGIVPAVVLGHSVGQYAASCVAGCLSREDGLRLIHHRGELTGSLPSGGAMAAVFASAEVVTERLASFPELAVAAFNGTHLVVSGPETVLNALGEALEADGIRFRRLQTSHAFHSALLDPVLDEFEQQAQTVRFEAARCPLVCNVTGEILPPDRILDAPYWRRQMREAVRYDQSIRSLSGLGCDVLLELGPQPVLTGMAAAAWAGTPSALIGSLQPGVNDTESMMQMLARLYVHGVTPRFEAVFADAPRTRVVLPTYPFQRERLWGIARPAAAQVVKDTQHPLLGTPMTLAGVAGERRFQSRIEPSSPRWLEDHRVIGDVVFPGAAFIDMALAAIGGRGVIEHAAFESPLLLPGGTMVQSVHRQGSGLEVFSCAETELTWKRHFSAATSPHELPPAASVSMTEIQALCPDEVSVESLYELFRAIGLEYGPEFRTVQTLRRGPQDLLVKVSCRSDYRSYVIPPPLLDGAFHSLGVGLIDDPAAPLFLPVGIQRVTVYGNAPNDLWCHGHWEEDDSAAGQRTANLVLFDDAGSVRARIDGLKLRRVSRAALRQLVGGGIDRLIYSIDWRPGALPEPATTISNWLIVRARTRKKHPLSAVLEQRGHRCVEVALSVDSAALPEPVWRDGHAKILADHAEQWIELLQRYFPAEAPSGPLHGILWITGEGSEEEASFVGSRQTQVHCSGVIGMLRALRTLRIETLDRGLQIVTRGAVATDSGDAVRPVASQFWGLARVIVNEHPSMRCRVTDADDASLERLADVAMTESWESQVALRAGKIMLPRLVPAKISEARPGEGVPVRREGTYLITGGLGMLGRRAAEWLAQRGAGDVVLVSRRPPAEESLAALREMEGAACRIHIKPADIADPASLAQLFAELDAELPPLRGVIHAAGVLEDSLLVEQNWEGFVTVLAPKVQGAWALHEHTAGRELDFFVLYSSAASVLGSPGQANYAAGNAFLDGLAQYRSALGLPALSINFGPWTEGMAATETVMRAMALQGITPLIADDAHRCIDALVRAGAVQAMILDVDWRRMRQRLPVQAPPFWDEIWPEGDDAAASGAVLLEKLRGCPESARADVLRTHLQNELKQILSLSQAPAPETPLASLGLDSLMAVEIGTRLQQQVGTKYAIPPTVAFDYPTVAALTDHLLQLLREAEPPVASAKPVREAATATDSVVIVGMGCRFPGADGLAAYWRILEQGIDATREIPGDRWDIAQIYAEERSAGKIYTRRGGFLEDLEAFDAEFFGMNQEEAAWMDPQHRLLLEVSWQALEDAALAPGTIVRSSVGVFMGIMSSDFAQRCEQQFSGGIDRVPFQGAGLSHSAGVGRVSSFFGFEGPCLAIDTASSSSLVAVCQAVRALLDGDCDMALAGGVNAILSPTNYLLLCKAGMLSQDGRCKSFSGAADGFGRGEGCGVVVLKRRADAERDGDRILAEIRGTAVLHNGSGGISAPNGRAQERLLRQALEMARINPSQVHYLEAHGTATALGDSIELRAALDVLSTGREATRPLLIGSAKANIGHLEAAGGISGLIKVVLAMHHGVIPRQIHCEEPTGHIPWDRVPGRVVTEPTPWPEPESPVAGVTALGMSGTNAHVLLQGPGAPAIGDAPERSQQLFVFSARSAESLAEQAQRLADFCSSGKWNSAAALADLCYSAGAGRQHFSERAAIVTGGVDDLVAALRDLAKGVTRSGIHRGAAVEQAPKVGWFYAGLPSAAGGSRGQLYTSEPIFRAAWDRCQELLGAEPEPGSRAELFAVQMGLSQLWRSWGVDTEVVLGEGTGQLAAACAAGMMRWEDGLLLAKLLDQGTTVEALDALEKVAATFDFLPPDKVIICQLTGKVVPVHRLWTGSYWRRFATEPHCEAAAWQTLQNEACDLLLAIGSPVVARESAIPVRSALQSGSEEILVALAELFVRGTAVDFRGLHAPWPRRKVSFPTYAFQRKRCQL
jgi:acyl transferase domain-containing protein/acyl carrier protein